MRVCAVVAASVVATAARLLHSLPEYTYAVPKQCRVSFLKDLPVLDETARRWLKDGLRGGELEFLDQPWKDSSSDTSSHLEGIGSAEAHTRDPATSSPDSSSSPIVSTNYTLKLIKMGPSHPYICLIPKPVNNGPALKDEDSDADVTLARSWSLLQPLSGTCLYHRQLWFTYRYCHNDEIRQFKEMAPVQSRFPGTHNPEEDPEWEAYTLGRAPKTPQPGADLTEQNAQAANLELAWKAGSRYLVQRWGDGTICDKTGKGREVEVQYHCSMEMTDHILFVKEAKKCSYVLAVNTPRLCGEPGFKSRHEACGEPQIRCGKVVDSTAETQLQQPPTDHPVKVPVRKTVLPAPTVVPNGEKLGGGQTKEKTFNDLPRKTLEVLVANEAGGGNGVNEDDELVIELSDEVDDIPVESDRVVDALRAAGYDIRAEVITLKDGSKQRADKKDDRKEKSPAKKPALDPHRDEL